MGIAGLALATSISAIVAVVLLLASLREKIGGLGLWVFGKSLVKIIVASVVMGGTASATFRSLKVSLGQELVDDLHSHWRRGVRCTNLLLPYTRGGANVGRS